MIKMSQTAAAVVAATLLFSAGDAQACACCTEPGQRFDLTDRIDNYARGELDQLRFAPAAVLFTGPGFPDDIKGVVSPSDRPYGVRARVGGVVAFEFNDPATRRLGRVQFNLPHVMTRFEVDPRADVQPAPPNGPALYKEWRLTNGARLGGILAASGSAATATLILHGEGNSCTSAYDFQRWTLSIKGKGIDFTFLGSFTR